MVEQGDIINVSGIDFPVLVISKNEYNTCGRALVCPVQKCDVESLFSQPIDIASYSGFVYLDDVKNLNLNVRKYVSRGRLPLGKQILFIGIVQSIFDYV